MASQPALSSPKEFTSTHICMTLHHFFVFVENFRKISGKLREKTQMRLYLSTDATPIVATWYAAPPTSTLPYPTMTTLVLPSLPTLFFLGVNQARNAVTLGTPTPLKSPTSKTHFSMHPTRVGTTRANLPLELQATLTLPYPTLP